VRLDYNADNFTDKPDWKCMIQNFSGWVQAWGDTAEDAIDNTKARMTRFLDRKRKLHDSYRERDIPIIDKHGGREVSHKDLVNRDWKDWK